jgi:hypothetical protein
MRGTCWESERVATGRAGWVWGEGMGVGLDGRGHEPGCIRWWRRGRRVGHGVSLRQGTRAGRRVVAQRKPATRHACDSKGRGSAQACDKARVREPKRGKDSHGGSAHNLQLSLLPFPPTPCSPPHPPLSHSPHFNSPHSPLSLPILHSTPSLIPPPLAHLRVLSERGMPHGLLRVAGRSPPPPPAAQSVVHSRKRREARRALRRAETVTAAVTPILPTTQPTTAPAWPSRKPGAAAGQPPAHTRKTACAPPRSSAQVCARYGRGDPDVCEIVALAWRDEPRSFLRR